jgi:hypothetical protein
MDRAVLNVLRRSLIRTKLQDGRLPVGNILRFWGGPGNGETCDACEDIITKDQMVMEGDSLTVGGGRPLQVHTECFRIWDAERPKLLHDRTA